MTSAIRQLLFILLLAIVFGAAGCSGDAENVYDITAKRLTVRSPWFAVGVDDVELQASYSGYDIEKQERFSRLAIGDKALEMIAGANDVILGTAFLFDILSMESAPYRDIVEELTTELIKKKQQNPDIVIAIVLDPINNGYSKRVSPAAKRLIENGVDIFYSDLISTKSATRLGVMHHFRRGLRFADTLMLGVLTPAL